MVEDYYFDYYQADCTQLKTVIETQGTMTIPQFFSSPILTTLILLGSGHYFLQCSSCIAFSIPSTLQRQSTGKRCPSSPLTPLHSSDPSATTTIPNESNKEEEEEDKKYQLFLDSVEVLCNERNIELTKVKNARDLSSVRNSPIPSNRIYRTGRISDASPQDIKALFHERNIKTLVDLRSPTELKEDPTLERSEVYGDFVSLLWSEHDSGAVKELNENEARISGNKNLARQVKDLVGGIKHFRNSTIADYTDGESSDAGDDIVMNSVKLAEVMSEGESEDELIIDEGVLSNVLGGEDNNNTKKKKQKRFVKEYSPNSIHMDTTRSDRKERHFVSPMNELKYVRGTLAKLRKRDIAKVLIKSPGAIVSRRVRSSVKDVFLSEINEGGLPMLNQLVLSFAAQGSIKYVLELCADETRHPIAFYCTAGKDRTGLISAIILSVLGVSDEDIVEDYSLSANVYAEMNDNKAMVGALTQRNLNPKTFLTAPPQVMRDTLNQLRQDYGSVEGYLDSIGFSAEDRQKLRSALLK